MAKEKTETLPQKWAGFNIKGFQEVSLLEWESKLTAILFLPGCNLRCPFCHAKSLVLEAERLETIPFEKIVDSLSEKKGWIDGVAITGGEPTLHNWLFDLIDEIKKLKLLVMVETNGTNPDKVKRLLESGRLNYIAMDIKAPLESSGRKYKRATAVDVDVKAIETSIDIIKSYGINHEFRTTVVPGIIEPEDIAEIARTIKGAKRLCLQQFSPKDTLDLAYSKVKPYPKKVLQEMAERAREFVNEAVIRNA